MSRTKGSKNKKTIEKEKPKEPPVSKAPSPPKFHDVAPKTDHPKIPECLVDGGMLYRWLSDLRKSYIEDKEAKKVIGVINEMMDYIMRMDKHERIDKENKSIQAEAKKT